MFLGGLQLYLKESLTRMFSCEFCEISKNTFFTEHLQTTASVETVRKACNFIKKRLQHRYFPVNIPEFLEQLFFIEQLRSMLLNYVLVSERIFNKESYWRDLISLFNVKMLQVSTSRSTTMRASVFLAKSADFFYHKIFEISR